MGGKTCNCWQSNSTAAAYMSSKAERKEVPPLHSSHGLATHFAVFYLICHFAKRTHQLSRLFCCSHPVFLSHHCIHLRVMDRGWGGGQLFIQIGWYSIFITKYLIFTMMPLVVSMCFKQSHHRILCDMNPLTYLCFFTTINMSDLQATTKQHMRSSETYLDYWKLDNNGLNL